MIHTIKKQKFIISTLIFSIIIIIIIIFTFSVDKNTNNKITEYIESIGWQIEKNPTEIFHYKIPVEFDSIFNTYNIIQKKSGFDLTNYKGKNVTTYSYKIINHRLSNKNTVIITIILFKGNIIGADISSNEQPKFIYEITNTNDLISS